MCVCLCMLIISGVFFSGLSGRAWVNFPISRLSGQHSMVRLTPTWQVMVCECVYVKCITNTININQMQHSWRLQNGWRILEKQNYTLMFHWLLRNLWLVCLSHFTLLLPALFVDSEETTWNRSFFKVLDKLALPHAAKPIPAQTFTLPALLLPWITK